MPNVYCTVFRKGSPLYARRVKKVWITNEAVDYALSMRTEKLRGSQSSLHLPELL